LDNAGYSVDQKASVREKISPEELAKTLLNEEQWRQILSSLVICFFARGIYQPDIILRALHLAGFYLTQDDLSRMGEDIHREKYRFKIREGFSFDDLRIPKRIFETASPTGKNDQKFMTAVVKHVKELLTDRDCIM
jgi:aldehyde:ferredoxin oxidoreductase